VLALMVFTLIICRAATCPERNPVGKLKSISAGEVYGFAPGRACSMAPAIRAQMKAIGDSLLKLRPSRVLVVGSADTSPLDPVTQAIYGNNAGLARSRVNCVAGWLATTSELTGMIFIPDVDGPKNLARADRKDRGVLVLALVP